MSAKRRHVVLGTAGHIDHGKTSLVKLLTGIDCDRLTEEKRRGITIELGFAPWKISDDLEASIIDVPGHERLVRTMVAGAGGMDVALLIVAADDGVMPQTREHMDVLRLLGVPAGVVVLTKCDLHADDPDMLELIEDDVRSAAAGTIFADAPVIHTSAHTRQGVEEVRKAVIDLAKAAKPRSDSGPGFLALDRLFTKAGFGTVGTGTTLRGTFEVGADVDVFDDSPEPITGLRIRGLQALGSDRQRVSAGMRTAINLAGKAVDQVKRGAVVASAGVFATVDSAIAWVAVLPQAGKLTDESLAAHLGTTERQARVIPLGTEDIEPGSEGGVLLRFDRPVAAYAGQRLVLRRPGVLGQATIGGGEVLDPEPRHGKGAVAMAASQLPLLRGDPKDRLLAIAQEARSRGVDLPTLRRRLPPGSGQKLAKQLEKKGQLVHVPGAVERWVDREWLDKLEAGIVGMLNAHHDTEPTSAGVPEMEIESRLPAPERGLFATAVQRAVNRKVIVRDGPVLSVPGRGSAADDEAKELMERIVKLQREGGFTPPLDKELVNTLRVSPARIAELMDLLRRQKKVVRVADGLHYDPDALGAVESAVLEALKDGKPKSVAELKPAMRNMSRKWAIPLLEHFDRQKVTQRSEGLRAIHSARHTRSP